ncbi:MAG: 50S ribosomal protein L23 [Candidatus Methylomirabilia bacterium]
MRDPRDVVVRPIMTEKSMRLKEERNTVTFRVAPDANKVEIRQAIEAVFNVRVREVRTARVYGKLKRLGRFQGRRPSWKKALVTLAPGYKIELVEGA